MNDITQKKSAFFSQILWVIGHHRFTSLLLAIAAIWLVYLLSAPNQEPLPSPSLASPSENQNALHANAKKAFALLETSLSLSQEEYEARAMYVLAQLKELRDTLGADNAFVFSFHPSSGQAESGDEEWLVSNTFEVNRDDVSPNLYLVQDLSNYAWEFVRNAQLGVYPYSGSEGYGMELYDRQKTQIGFLGASSLKKVDAFLVVNEEDFKEWARRIEIALSYPLADFRKLQAE